VEVQGELGFSQDFEAFAVGFHQSVFDAVVDHFDEVSAAGGAGVDPAVFGSEGIEDGFDSGDGGFFAADHHAVAFGAAPDSA